MSVDLKAVMSITAPSGVDGRGEVAVLNDAASGNFVGYLVDSSGFESPTVRISSDPIPEGDGAVMGTGYYGPREFTLNINVQGAATDALSHARLDKLLRATNAMRSNGTITWTETGGSAKLLYFRRAAPLRGPSTERSCLFSGISGDPRIYSGGSETTATAGTSLSLTNAGNAGTLPRFTVASPSAAITFTNSTTGESLVFAGLDGSGTLTVDFLNKTVTRGSDNKYDKVVFPTSTWWELAPGVNSISVTNAATPFFRSAWI